jgi:polyisoprenoid-binding protein YceI
MNTRGIAALAGIALGSIALAATQWQLVPGGSRLGFSAVQAGAEFQGAFKRFDASIQFDPATPNACRFDVRIDMASVDTQDDERDQILKGADLFAVDTFPRPRYIADRCAVAGKQFVGHGKLTLRNVTRDVPITFTLQEREGSGTLRGTATLRRLDFGVGQGEWKDTQWVGNDVRINFELQLKATSS